MSLIAAAYAQEAATTTAAAAQQPSALAGALPLILIAVVFYFLLIRPQQKKYKDHVALVSGIAKGDKIITSGGVIGKVTKVDAEKDLLHVEIADGVEIQVVRSTVSAVLDASGKPVVPGAAPVAANDSAPAKKTTAKTTAKKNGKAA